MKKELIINETNMTGYEVNLYLGKEHRKIFMNYEDIVGIAFGDGYLNPEFDDNYAPRKFDDRDEELATAEKYLNNMFDDIWHCGTNEDDAVNE